MLFLIIFPSDCDSQTLYTDLKKDDIKININNIRVTRKKIMISTVLQTLHLLACQIPSFPQLCVESLLRTLFSIF